MSPADPGGHPTSAGAEMAGFTAHASRTAIQVGAVASATAIKIGSSRVAVETGAGAVEPNLTDGMTARTMAIVTAVGAVVVQAAGSMALIADGNRGGEIGAIVGNVTVSPGALVRRILTAGGAEVTFVAAAPGTATLEIAAVADRAAVNIGLGGTAVETTAGFIQPGLPKRMGGFGVAIVTSRRRIAIEPILVMTLIASCGVGRQAVVGY